MTTEEYKLYERRIDNCFRAADNSKDEDFKKFWYQTAMALLRKMNGRLAQRIEQLPSKQWVEGSSPSVTANTLG
jgi:hypothetical protein